MNLDKSKLLEKEEPSFLGLFLGAMPLQEKLTQREQFFLQNRLICVVKDYTRAWRLFLQLLGRNANKYRHFESFWHIKTFYQTGGVQLQKSLLYRAPNL